MTVELTKLESSKIYAVLMLTAKDYSIKMTDYESEHGQDNKWQEIRERRDYYRCLASKFA